MKFVTLSSLVLVLYLAGSTVAALTTVDVEDNEKACCPLKWLSPDESTAPITVETGNRNYWFVKDNLTLGFREALTQDSSVQVLNNVYNCNFSWIKSADPVFKTKMHQFYMPLTNDMAFAVSTKRYRNSYPLNWVKVAEYYDIFQTNSGSICSTEVCNAPSSYEHINRTILYVNCVESAKNILVSQLNSISLDEASVLSKSVKVRIDEVEVTNSQAKNMTYRFFVKKPVPFSFNSVFSNYEIPYLNYLKNETDVETFLENNPEFVLRKIVDSSVQLSSLLPQINAGGKYLTEIIAYAKFDKKIIIPPNSTCNISAYITSYDVEEPVAVSFAVVPAAGFEGHWNNRRILSSFQATGLDTSRLIEENGKLLLKYQGTLTVNSFTNGDIDVACDEMGNEIVKE